jgi:hypothetical protein
MFATTSIGLRVKLCAMHTNTRERSETVGGRLNVWSESHIGSEVELRIPGEIAYALAPNAPYKPILRFLFSSLRSKEARARLQGTHPEDGAPLGG